MKKIISVFIVVLVLLSCFSFGNCVFADKIISTDEPCDLDPKVSITFSEDFKTLYYGNVTYSAFPNSQIPFTFDCSLENSTLLTEKQKKDVLDISLTASPNGFAIQAEIDYTYGAYFTIFYLRDDLIKEYNRLSATTSDEFYIIFTHFYEEDKDLFIKTSHKLLKGEKVKLEVDEILLDDWFNVEIKSDKMDMSVAKGTMLDYDGEYYYVDFAETNSDPNEFDHYAFKGDAYKITDPALIQQIEDKLEEYYEIDYGMFFDDNFTKVVSRVFIIIIFAVIPFVILGLTLILAIKSKNPYKKLHLTACILSAAELLTLALILIIT
jgi:hypothetical protein